MLLNLAVFLIVSQPLALLLSVHMYVFFSVGLHKINILKVVLYSDTSVLITTWCSCFIVRFNGRSFSFLFFFCFVLNARNNLSQLNVMCSHIKRAKKLPMVSYPQACHRMTSLFSFRCPLSYKGFRY